MPTENVIVHGTQVNPASLSRHSLQLSVALGLALRKDREVRA